MRAKICISVLIVLLACSKIPVYSVPDFNLPDIDGNDVRLYKILNDGPVVFVIWALWNKMSIKELDALKTFSEDLESMEIQVLAISQDKSRAAPQVKPFAIDHDWIDAYVVVLDTANIIRELYNIEAMPATIAIDQEGELAFTWMGYKPGDEIIIMDTLLVLFGN